MDRRTLFRSAVAGGLLTGAATGARGATETTPLVTGPQGPLPPLPQLTDHGEMRGEMLYRKLGWTGESVSAIGFGGSHFSKPGIDQVTSIRLCHAALDRGMNFMDNSWDYNKGESEIRMGTARSSCSRPPHISTEPPNIPSGSVRIAMRRLHLRPRTAADEQRPQP